MITAHRPHPNSARLAVPLLAVCLLVAALAGCSNDPARRATPRASSDHTGRAAALRLASCLRRHGVAVLAPGPQGYDATHPLANNGDRTVLGRAAKACGLPPLPSSTTSAANAASQGYPAGTRAVRGTLGGAPYRIELPRAWNRVLILWSHGYQTQTSPQADDPGALTTSWLLQNGYAIAASGYRSTGWAIAEALPDQIRLLDYFAHRYGRPLITIAAGESLGGLISEGLAQRHPKRISGALSLCGVTGGALGFWNQALDAALVVRTLLTPRSPLELTGIKHPARDRTLLLAALERAQHTPSGRARLALAAAMLDLPAWHTEPQPTTTAARTAQLIRWLVEQLPQYATQGRLDTERRAGDNPSWTAGVDYEIQLDRSVDRRLVRMLYRTARVSLARDLRSLGKEPRINADAHAVAYLDANLTPDGALKTPVVTLHTAGDGVVPQANEQALASAVHEAGAERFLRQLFVGRAGHCSFTAAEQVAALQVLLQRLRSGAWPHLSPAILDTDARRLGTRLNAIDESDAYGTTHVPPRFVQGDPPKYLRPSLPLVAKNRD